MLETFFKNVFYMIIRKRVIDLFALFLIFDKVRKAQRFKLMGYRRFCHAQQNSQVAYAHFLTGQCPQNLYAGVVRKHLIKICQIIEVSTIGHNTANVMYHILMNYTAITDFIVFHIDLS